jgi:rRNA maturation endonuclease Nob1
MANRGNSPKPDPRSTCNNPRCGRYFDPTPNGKCPYCGHKRGELEKRASAEYEAKRKAALDSL